MKLKDDLTDIRAQCGSTATCANDVSTANLPASTTVEVSKLAIEVALYEVEAIAVLLREVVRSSFARAAEARHSARPAPGRGACRSLDPQTSCG